MAESSDYYNMTQQAAQSNLQNQLLMAELNMRSYLYAQMAQTTIEPIQGLIMAGMANACYCAPELEYSTYYAEPKKPWRKRLVFWAYRLTLRIMRWLG